MDCPKCRERIEVKKRNGVVLYSCLYCEGTWLPKESLERLYKASSDKYGAHRIAQLKNESKESATPLKCPACVEKKLRVILVKRVELDICIECGGVFFDAGEMDTLIKKPKLKSEAGVAEYVATEGLFWIIIGFISGG